MNMNMNTITKFAVAAAVSLSMTSSVRAQGASSQPVKPTAPKAPVVLTPAVMPVVAPAPAVPAMGALQWSTKGFSTPESVLWDSPRARYLVSNINGKPTDVDNNGFISALGADGKMLADKFIAGGTPGIKLDAPKGMAVVGDVLYVADITQVRMFDVISGKAKGSVKIKGATFLNDVAAAADGKVYVTDSGLKPDFSRSNTDAIWVVERTKATKLLGSPELNQPNGVVVDGAFLWVVSFGAPELRRISIDDKKVVATSKLPGGGLDGVALMPSGKLVVSSWEKKMLWLGESIDQTTWAWKDIVSVEAPADFDVAGGSIVVPHFMANMVESYTAPK
jgi:hypothetical protein